MARKPVLFESDVSGIAPPVGPVKKPKSTRPKISAKPRRTSPRKPPVVTARPEPAEAPLPVHGLDQEEVARLAYAYWLERGGQGGSAENDWYRAEQELRARKATSSGA
jgi:hypothetical protein